MLTNKMMERVMVVPKDETIGFEAPFSKLMERDVMFGASHFEDHLARVAGCMQRGYCEVDSRFLQVIPYVLMMKSGGKFLVARRKTGDPKLVGGVTIGMGGHIKFGESPRQAAIREIMEETGKVGVTSNLEFTGCLIHPRKTEVDRVHIGMVWVCRCEEDFEPRGDGELEFLGWSPLAELRDFLHMESWSKLVIEHMETIFGGEA